MASQNTQKVSSTGRKSSASTRKLHDTESSLGNAADDALSVASDVTQQAAQTAKDAASRAVNLVSGQVRELLDAQVVTGADMIGHLASSARLAADDLDENVPAAGKLVRGIADRIETVADDIRDRSAEDIFNTAVDFTRRQPALTFGLAALAGFVVFRALKSTAPAMTSALASSPSIQPDREHEDIGSHENQGS